MRTLPSLTLALVMLALVAGCESDNNSTPRHTESAVLRDDAAPPPAAQATPAPADTVYDVGDLAVRPIAVSRTAPTYPFALRRHGVQGEAVIEFIVTTKGNVVDAHVLRATEPEFGGAALAAVERWRFRPGKVEGRPVNVRMQVPIVFALNSR